MKKCIRFFIISLVLLNLSTCGIMSNFQTAEVPKKGTHQLTPAASLHYYNSKDVALIPSEGFIPSLKARYQYSLLDFLAVGLIYDFPTIFSGNVKTQYIDTDSVDMALDLSFGIIKGTDSKKALMGSITPLFTFYTKKKLSITLAPKATLISNDSDEYLFGGTITLGYKISEKITLLPEVGSFVDYKNSNNFTTFHAGLGVGIDF